MYDNNNYIVLSLISINHYIILYVVYIFSRIPFYATTFQLLYTAETTMHDELAKVKAQLTNMMGSLFERASDYKIKNKFFPAG